MKFLIDRCAGRRLAEWLRQVGHEVSHIVHRYEQGRQSPDEIVQAYPHLTLAQVPRWPSIIPTENWSTRR